MGGWLGGQKQIEYNINRYNCSLLVMANVRVYECAKGVKRVQGLQKEDLIDGDKLGVLPASVSILLGDNHIEFSVVLEGRRGKKADSSSGTIWLGFHFFGQFPNIQKCFRHHHSNLESISAVLHKNLTSKFSDPFACPVLIIGEGSAKAFWQISSAEKPEEVLGFIPLHRTEIFHTLNSYPILFFEGEQTTVVIGSDLDRNHLFPLYPEVDTLHMQTLRKLYALFKSQKWCCVVLPEAEPTLKNSNWQVDDHKDTGSTFQQPNSDQSRQFDLDGVLGWLSRRGPLTLVADLSVWRKENVKDIDLLSIHTSPSGRSHVVHILHTFTLSPYFRSDAENSGFDLEKCKQVFDKLVDDIKELKAISAHGTAIYNPFLAHSYKNTSNPVVVESRSLDFSNPKPFPAPSLHPFPYLPADAFIPEPTQTNIDSNNNNNNSNLIDTLAPPAQFFFSLLNKPNENEQQHAPKPPFLLPPPPPQWQDPGILQTGNLLPITAAANTSLEGVDVNVLAKALASVLIHYQ